jgi:hypothetical protein
LKYGTFILNLNVIEYAIFVSAGLSEVNVQKHLSAADENSGRLMERAI